MLKKGFVVSRLINWRIERDDALGTLFFTFVLLWLGGVRKRLHTWHPARFWFESEVEDCLVPVGAGTGLLVGCENEGSYMLLSWSLLMRRSTLTSRVISKQKPLCVRTHRNWTFRSWSKSWCFRKLAMFISCLDQIDRLKPLGWPWSPIWFCAPQ